MLSVTAMDFVHRTVDLVLHLNTHLDALVHDFGLWTYLIIFLIIFCETGIVVTPFLPGDSLLFAAGAICAGGSLHLAWLFVLLPIAAIAGDNSNYWLGRLVGPKIFSNENVRWLNRRHLDRTHLFYEKHGGKAVVIARFMPIIRTFAPFVAGIGRMAYGRFLLFSIGGGLLWISLCLTAGFLFGNLPIVKKNFSLLIFAIIGVSLIPAVVAFIQERRGRK